MFGFVSLANALKSKMLFKKNLTKRYFVLTRISKYSTVSFEIEKKERKNFKGGGG